MHLARAFLLLVLLVPLLSLGGLSADCPRRCSCDAAGGSVQCFRLVGVPSPLPLAARKLYISHSKIKHLQLSDFNSMSHLEEFTLLASGTESIENNTFQTLSSLKTLELWKNKLRRIPSLLPASLQVLKLNDNSISVLRESDFEGLVKLQVLELRNNMVSTLSFRTLSSPSSLQSLVLDGNGLESFSGPPHLPCLKHLSMEKNQLRFLPPGFFASLQHLRFLSLAGNLLTRVPVDLPKSLLSLKLERNRLKAVKFRDIRHLENLSHLFLSDNLLSSIDGAQFLANLTTLELSQNQFRALPSRLPSRLQKLDCSNNQIQRVTAQDFHGLRELKHLFLDNNIVSLFEAGALQKCGQLSNLALEQNLLVSIPLRLPNTLARLDLKGNRIRDIGEQEMRDLKQLQVLNLRNNKLSALDLRVLESLPRLRHLYLDGNPWNCTCDLLRARKVLTARGTDVRGGQCTAPAESQGENWMSSKKIMQQCESHFHQPEKAKELRKKAKSEDQMNTDDDYYDYELDYE
ncbi:nephrocan-like [Ornithorhynchus anatinus]|nr:nephrocan-like [Ornithorhynchus anatinus]